MSEETTKNIFTNVKPPKLPKQPKVPKQPKDPQNPEKKNLNPFLVILRVIVFAFQCIGTVLLIGLTTGALLTCIGAVYIKTVIMPQTTLDLSNFFVGQNSVMYYTDNETGQAEEMVTILSTTSSIWKNYDEFPIELIQATVAIEDKRFWDHPGIDWRRTGYAVVSMFTGRDIQGGSTLTQQLIKNLTAYDDVTVKRKIIEIFRALELDSNYSKQDIITWYLNIIYLGEGCQGAGAASWEYFGKDVSELSLAECASLISITNNPSYYTPYSTLITNNFPIEGVTMNGVERNKYRQELVLYELYDQGTISEHEYNMAVSEVLNFVRSAEDSDEATIYTWFEETVLEDVRKDLIEEYGYSYEAANLMLASGGLSIYTTIDYNVQNIVDSVYQDWSNLPYTSTKGQPLQSAMTVIDNATGDVVAIAGQMGVKDKNLLKNFATTANRQPGSAIKPLSVYAPALEYGVISPVSILDDYPYSIENGSVWPRNAYGYYNGMSDLDFALQQSSNAVAVRIVGDYLTPEVSFNYMNQVLDFDLVESGEYYGVMRSDKSVAPLALGGLTEGVNTRDMAEGYATFTRDGNYTYSRTYTKVLDSNGEIVLDNTPKQHYAMATTTAYYMNELLKGVVNSGTATAAKFSNMTIAGKTGTTNDNYDLWFVGYTPYYTAAVWTGYEYNEYVTTYGNPNLSMWKKVMEPLHNGLPNMDFEEPVGLVSVSYCRDSGLLPNSYCSADSRGNRVTTEMIYSSHAPMEVCSSHGPGSSRTYCLNSPVYDSEGNPTGSYHLASIYCPSTSQRTTGYLTINRTIIGGAYARDSGYTYSGGWQGSCQVHTADGYVAPVIPVPEGETEEDEESTGNDSPFGDLFPQGDSSDSSSGSSSSGSNSGSSNDSSDSSSGSSSSGDSSGTTGGTSSDSNSSTGGSSSDSNSSTGGSSSDGNSSTGGSSSDNNSSTGGNTTGDSTATPEADPPSTTPPLPEPTPEPTPSPEPTTPNTGDGIIGSTGIPGVG